MRTGEERSMNSECSSVQRTSKNRELRVVQKTLEIFLSETHASGNREDVDSTCKGSSGQGMKGGQKKAYKTTRRKVHFAALMDVRHIQKYEYVPKNVRKSNLKCGHKYEYILVNVRKSNLKCCQTIECNLSIRFCVILFRRLGSRNDLSSVMVAERAQ